MGLARLVAGYNQSLTQKQWVRKLHQPAKKAPKQRNEPIMLCGINNLTEKTNPNEATKSFRLGVPFENEPNLGSTGSTEGCHHPSSPYRLWHQNVLHDIIVR